MRKREIIDIAKMLSKECFKLYLKKRKLDIGIKNEETIIEGFKDEESVYRMVFYMGKLKDVRCEILYDKKSKLFHSFMFERVIYD